MEGLGSDHQTIELWLSQLSQAFHKKEDGSELASLIDPRSVLHETFKQRRPHHLPSPAFVDQLLSGLPYKKTLKLARTPLKSFVLTIYKIIFELDSASTIDSAQIVTLGISALNAWIELYRSIDTYPLNWMIPTLSCLLEFLSEAGSQADNQQQRADCLDIGDDNEPSGDDKLGGEGALQQTYHQQQVLNAIRQHIGKFRGDEHRQAGYIVLMSASIQACTTLGNLQMASAFLKTVESSALNFSKIPKQPLIAFKYYLGKLYMQQEKFQKAEEALAWCHLNSEEAPHALARHVAECLIAVRLRLGKISPKELIQQYNLKHYEDLIESLHSGDVQKFENVFATYTKHLIEEGTLLCIEKLKSFVYRTLFKSILDRYQAEDATKSSNVIPIRVFTEGFKPHMAGDFDIEFDDDEMSCVIANLIAQGHVKGYIAWDHGKIVLSKVTPVATMISEEAS